MDSKFNETILNDDIKEMQRIKNLTNQFILKKIKITTEIDLLDNQIKELTFKKQSLSELGDIGKLSALKKIAVAIDKANSDKADLTDILIAFETKFKEKIKADLDLLVLERRQDRSNEYCYLQHKKVNEFKKLINLQWDIYFEMIETNNTYHSFQYDLKNIYDDLGIDLDIEIKDAFSRPGLMTPLELLNPLKNNIFNGFIPDKHRTYLKID